MRALTAGLRWKEPSITLTQLWRLSSKTFSVRGILANSSCHVVWAASGEARASNPASAAGRTTREDFTGERIIFKKEGYPPPGSASIKRFGLDCAATSCNVI